MSECGLSAIPQPSGGDWITGPNRRDEIVLKLLLTRLLYAPEVSDKDASEKIGGPRTLVLKILEVSSHKLVNKYDVGCSDVNQYVPCSTASCKRAPD